MEANTKEFYAELNRLLSEEEKRFKQENGREPTEQEAQQFIAKVWRDLKAIVKILSEV